MKKLSEKDIIVRYSARVDYHKLGYEYYKTHVFLKNKKSLQKLLSYIEGTTDMINVVRQIAPWDLEIVHFNNSFSSSEL